MKNKFGNLSTVVWLAAMEAKRDPVAFLRRLERGDADSSGSTLRTVGIVALVIAVVGVLGAAVYSAATSVAGKIGTGFTFGP